MALQVVVRALIGLGPIQSCKPIFKKIKFVNLNRSVQYANKNHYKNTIIC